MAQKKMMWYKKRIFPKLIEIKLLSNGKTWYNKHEF